MQHVCVLAQKVATVKKNHRISALVRRLPAWITPNMVTALRMLLAVPVALLLYHGALWSGLALGSFAMTLDFLDGAIAEAAENKTDLGAFSDPLADKMVIGAALIGLMPHLSLPFVVAAWLVIFFSIVLTVVRVVKWLRRLPIAASTSGKMKLIAEVVGSAR